MLNVFKIEQSQKWDEIVKSFKEYDVYYLSGYVKAFQIHGDGEPLLFFYEDNKCRGINVVMKRDISLDKHFKGLLEEGKFYDFSTPYGYGGWLIEGTERAKLFDTYEKWCVDNGVISEFVRFHPVLDNYKYSLEKYEIVELGKTIAIDTRNRDAIWINFDKKNRNVIRKAINSGIVIKKGLSKELFDSFIIIYNGTMDKDNASEYYYFKKEFYESILCNLKDNAIIFYAELNKKIIAASIIIYANKKMNYHLSGSLREYQNLAPTNYLLWETSNFANELGCDSFHLGGGVGSKEDSLYRFKKAFYKGEPHNFYIGKKIYNKKTYEELAEKRKTITNNSFFPLYRG